MYLRLITVLLSLFIPVLAGCNILDEIFKRNFSLSSVANFPDDVHKLKEIWFYCETCLNNPACTSDDTQQCNTVTLPSRVEALSKATRSANAEAVYFLVDVAKTDVNEGEGEYQETPLITASYYGSKRHQDIASFLLSRGADINKAYRAVGGTPLGVAMWKRNINFARFLLTQGADPSATVNGRYEGYACENAIDKNLPELFPFIPGCCATALHDLNFDPNIPPLVIPQCQNIQTVPVK